MQCHRRASQSGTSLIEWTMGLALLAAALRLALPDVQAMVRTSALNAAAEEVLAELRHARSEALTHNRRVTMCKSGDGSSCSASDGWEQGWILFHDGNNNGVRDGMEEVIARHSALRVQLRVTGNTPLARYVSYSAIGTTRLIGGGFQAGTLTVCIASAGPTEARQIVLNALGRPRLQKTTVASCA
jgi:type IV fimbrial biogenesis protein FimT